MTTLNAQAIQSAALAIVDEEGADKLTMRRVASRLGVEAPSLYHHVQGKDALLDNIVDFITDSPAVRDATMVPMRIMGVVTPILAVGMIVSEALFGAGNPKFVAVVQFILIFFVLLPLAYLFAIVFALGLVGIWLAACVYVALAAVAMTLKWKGGSWKTIEL